MRYRTMRSPSRGISFISRNDAQLRLHVTRRTIYGNCPPVFVRVGPRWSLGTTSCSRRGTGVSAESRQKGGAEQVPPRAAPIDSAAYFTRVVGGWPASKTPKSMNLMGTVPVFCHVHLLRVDMHNPSRLQRHRWFPVFLKYTSTLCDNEGLVNRSDNVLVFVLQV